MNIFWLVMEWLLVLAMLGFFGAIVWIALAALGLVKRVKADGKRLRERPTRSVKNLVAAGKGIVQQETVRVKHIAASGKVAVDAVKDVAGDVQTAVKSIDPDDLKAALSDAKTVVRTAGQLAKIVRTIRRTQGVG